MDKKIDTGPVQSSKNVLLDNAPSLVTLVDDYLRNEIGRFLCLTPLQKVNEYAVERGKVKRGGGCRSITPFSSSGT